MKRLMAGCLIAALVFLLLCEFTLPGMVEGILDRQLQASEFHPGSVSTRVYAFPAAELLLGRFDGARLVMDQVAVDELVARSLELDIPRGKIAWNSLITGDYTTAIMPVAPIRARVIIDQDQLNRYLESQVSIQGMTNPHLGLSPEGVRLTSTMNLLGSSIELQLKGKFRIVGDSKITLDPDSLTVDGNSLPETLTSRLVSRLTFDLNQHQLPFDFKVVSVNTGDRCLIVNGVLTEASFSG